MPLIFKAARAEFGKLEHLVNEADLYWPETVADELEETNWRKQGRGCVRINIQIERLVLDRLPVEHHQASLLKAAVEAELSRFLVADGLATHLMSGGAVDSVRAPGIQFGSDSNPVKLGQQIGRALNGALEK